MSRSDVTVIPFKRRHLNVLGLIFTPTRFPRLCCGNEPFGVLLLHLVIYEMLVINHYCKVVTHRTAFYILDF